MNSPTRRVSVIAPCRNEREHVLAFCDAVAAQRLPNGVAIEVLVADGQSDDGTRELLDARCAADARFVRVDNPGRIVSTGLNRCLERARGAVIVRMDLHSVYEGDYIAQCLAALERSGAANVGGPWRAEGDASMPHHAPGGATLRDRSRGATQRDRSRGATQRAIAAAFQSRWVAGGARSRDLGYEGPVDTVYLGCWPRETFDRHGGFDETLARNQDDEHNLRLVRAGATVWQSALIRSRYRPRASLAQLFAQQRQYGYWKAFVMKKHGRAASLRQLVPGAFVAALGALAAASLAWPVARVGLLALLGAYALYVAAATLAIARSAGLSRTRSAGLSRTRSAGLPRARSAGLSLLPRLPLVIAAYHFGYGLGSLRGWVDVLVRGAPSPAFGVLTR